MNFSPNISDNNDVNIIETNSYTKYFDEMLIFLKSDEMKKLKYSDNELYWNKINLKNDGKLSYKIIDLLDEDINNEDKIRKILGVLRECKNGKRDIVEETKKFDNETAEKYLFPSFGGKDNFFKKIQELEKTQESSSNDTETNQSKLTNSLKKFKKAKFVGGKRI